MTRAADLEARLARASDAVLIPGIYNYCHRRCERCEFTGRCLLYRENQEEARRHGEDHRCGEEILANLVVAGSRIAAHQEGLDEIATAVERDSLYVLASSCAAAAHAVVDPLQELSRFHEWPPDVAEAIDTIGWHAGEIPAKIYRALSGRAEADPVHEDPIQNDWNGSVKVARLAIRESCAAWAVLFAAGETPLDAPIRQTHERLEQIDRELAARFPLAMEFVRPGFDEADVEAGDRTAAAPGRQRPRLRQRIAAWLAARFLR